MTEHEPQKEFSLYIFYCKDCEFVDQGILDHDKAWDRMMEHAEEFPTHKCGIKVEGLKW